MPSVMFQITFSFFLRSSFDSMNQRQNFQYNESHYCLPQSCPIPETRTLVKFHVKIVQHKLKWFFCGLKALLVFSFGKKTDFFPPFIKRNEITK